MTLLQSQLTPGVVIPELRLQTKMRPVQAQHPHLQAEALTSLGLRVSQRETGL